MGSKIVVISSYAQDRLVSPQGKIVKNQLGGPILFLHRALKDSGIPHELIYGDKINVEILISERGEFGKVLTTPKVQPLPFLKPSSWVIISTVLQEWDLTSLLNFEGRVFVDIQGFVRDGSDFGKKKYWEEVAVFADKIFCLKGTRQEVSYLPKEVLENQKQRLLVITDGDQDLEVFYQGKRFFIPVEQSKKPKDTIGAGDIFLGYLVASMYQGKNPLEAVKHATYKVAQFLRSK